MKLRLLCTATAAALLSVSAIAQTQSGTGIRSNPGMTPGIPSTATSGDAAGAADTTAPRSGASETSVGVSGATRSTGSAEASGRCDTLIGDERARCLNAQASTGASTSGSAGPGSTGSGSGASSTGR